jgi:hypothetical protein
MRLDVSLPLTVLSPACCSLGNGGALDIELGLRYSPVWSGTVNFFWPALDTGRPTGP